MKHCHLLFAAMSFAALTLAVSQGGRWGRGPGMGMGGGGMMMGGGPNRGTGRDYAQVFHALISAHQSVKRTYEHTDDGIVSLTESNDPRIASLIKLHVEQMTQLM
jgi:hypothetical protein